MSDEQHFANFRPSLKFRKKFYIKVKDRHDKVIFSYLGNNVPPNQKK